MSVIVDVYAREILDSRGNPTVEVDVTLKTVLSVGLQSSWSFTGLMRL